MFKILPLQIDILSPTFPLQPSYCDSSHFICSYPLVVNSGKHIVAVTAVQVGLAVLLRHIFNGTGGRWVEAIDDTSSTGTSTKILIGTALLSLL